MGDRKNSDRRLLWRVVGLYAIFGMTWIVVTDRGLGLLGIDLDAMIRLAILKGALYVLISSGALYVVLGRELRARAEAEERAQALEAEKERADAQHKKLEAQLAVSRKLEVLGLLAAGVAHDFNNLLTIINTNALMLAGNFPASDPTRADVEAIAGAGTRASALTRQLLTFARTREAKVADVDLNELLRQLTPVLERIGRGVVKLETALDPALPHLSADASQLEQVVLNLFMNAKDAVGAKGTVTLRTRAEGKTRVFEVVDTGVGMDEATRARLFEPFFTTKEPGKGTGLGLAIVFGIVSKSGGTIDVESEPGKGACFRITWPA